MFKPSESTRFKLFHNADLAVGSITLNWYLTVRHSFQQRFSSHIAESKENNFETPGTCVFNIHYLSICLSTYLSFLLIFFDVLFPGVHRHTMKKCWGRLGSNMRIVMNNEVTLLPSTPSDLSSWRYQDSPLYIFSLSKASKCQHYSYVWKG